MSLTSTQKFPSLTKVGKSFFCAEQTLLITDLVSSERMDSIQNFFVGGKGMETFWRIFEIEYFNTGI
jgi:hypothetical protein